MSFPPEWHALGREAELSAEQIAQGVTALGKANHAQKGIYTQAFFGLSIGLERLAKLILIADHAISNSGAWMTNAALKSKSHDLEALFKACEPISVRYRSDTNHFERPNDPIHLEVVKTLSEFATLSRYFNLDLVSKGNSGKQLEPIQAWWGRVGEPILKRHYSAKQAAKDVAEAELMDRLMGSNSFVLHHDEKSHPITDLTALVTRASATRVVQKFGRLYVMQLVRWLALLMSELSNKGAYEYRIEALLGLDEPFTIFKNEDRVFKDRKTWSIYRL